MANEGKPGGSAWREFGQAVTGSVASSAKSWALWALVGAVIGALGLAYAGARLNGLEGMFIGAAIGVAVGAVAAWLLRLWAAINI